MEHDQIQHEGNGVYVIENLADESSEMTFEDIEQSLRGQGFRYQQIGEEEENEYGLVEINTGIKMTYDLDEEAAYIHLTELSPTKEKVLPEALVKGHIDQAFSLAELYVKEKDANKEKYFFGTEEYNQIWEG